jgi:hypothetical protein
MVYRATSERRIGRGLEGEGHRTVYPPSMTMLKPAPGLQSHSTAEGNLCRSAEPSEGDLVDHRFHVLGGAGDCIGDHRRIAGAGADGVDPDALAGVFQCCAASQSDGCTSEAGLLQVAPAFVVREASAA